MLPVNDPLGRGIRGWKQTEGIPPTMKPTPLTVTPLVLLSLAMLCSPASGAEPPKLLYLNMNRQLRRAEPPKTGPVYVKKETWHEKLFDTWVIRS